jgi:hypothetical protein
LDRYAATQKDVHGFGIRLGIGRSGIVEGMEEGGEWAIHFIGFLTPIIPVPHSAGFVVGEFLFDIPCNLHEAFDFGYFNFHRIFLLEVIAASLKGSIEARDKGERSDIYPCTGKGKHQGFNAIHSGIVFSAIVNVTINDIWGFVGFFTGQAFDNAA